MTPLTQNPKLVVLLNPDTGTVMKTATNIDREVQVKATFDPNEFDTDAQGMPFQTNIALNHDIELNKKFPQNEIDSLHYMRA